MDLRAFVDARGGIVHRSVLLAAGVAVGRLRGALAAGEIERVRRYWVATTSAPHALRTAAEASGHVACVTAARHRGWWLPEAPDTTHLHVPPHGRLPGPLVVAHWTRPIVAVAPTALVESIEDSLDHIATCLDAETALVLWESACRRERLGPADLRRVRWRSASARALSGEVSGLHDSGLETIFVSRLRYPGLTIRCQVIVAGRRVDALLGERLIVQLDGFEFHSSAADRTRDAAHDRELTARGYTVIRFTYAEVLHHWPVVERAVSRALAQGLHFAE